MAIQTETGFSLVLKKNPYIHNVLTLMTDNFDDIDHFESFDHFGDFQQQSVFLNSFLTDVLHAL